MSSSGAPLVSDARVACPVAYLSNSAAQLEIPTSSRSRGSSGSSSRSSGTPGFRMTNRGWRFGLERWARYANSRRHACGLHFRWVDKGGGGKRGLRAPSCEMQMEMGWIGRLWGVHRGRCPGWSWRLLEWARVRAWKGEDKTTTRAPGISKVNGRWPGDKYKVLVGLGLGGESEQVCWWLSGRRQEREKRLGDPSWERKEPYDHLTEIEPPGPESPTRKWRSTKCWLCVCVCVGREAQVREWHHRDSRGRERVQRDGIRSNSNKSAAVKLRMTMRTDRWSTRVDMPINMIATTTLASCMEELHAWAKVGPSGDAHLA